MNRTVFSFSWNGSSAACTLYADSGYEPAERKIVCFLPSYEEETMEPPIRILEVKPVSPRFAEALTHRDYLGALMNLGIERSMLGDIVINEDGCFIFCWIGWQNIFQMN